MKACSLHFTRLHSTPAQQGFTARTNPQVPEPPPANAYSAVVDSMVYSQPEKAVASLQKIANPSFGSGGDGRWEAAQEISQSLLSPAQAEPAKGLSINGYYLAPEKVAQLAAGNTEKRAKPSPLEGRRGETLADQLERIQRDADAEIARLRETTRKRLQQSNDNHFQAVMDLLKSRPLGGIGTR